MSCVASGNATREQAGRSEAQERQGCRVVQVRATGTTRWLCTFLNVSLKLFNHVLTELISRLYLYQQRYTDVLLSAPLQTPSSAPTASCWPSRSRA